jgi:hypothetical protein
LKKGESMVPDGKILFIGGSVVHVTYGAITGTMTSLPIPQYAFDVDYSAPVPADPGDLDRRLDPKAWAEWFREFLFSRYGRFREAFVGALPRLRHFQCWSHWLPRTPLRREWVWKDWQQKVRKETYALVR